ncbi:siphovirus Gp157 family protein [Vibrio casei]|uniref:siphovirus Gp157 family protein n=1 Tax=Vibrio casei TaxID=673372 RepID=UPI003F976199
MSKLYEIANSYAELENSDMDKEMIADTLDGIKGEFEDKALNILVMIKNSESMSKALKDEAKSLSERAKQEQNKADNLKEYLASAMSTMEAKSLCAGVHKISLRKGVQSVFIYNIDSIPAEYVSFETVTKPDKNLIKEKLKLGEKIDGVSLVTGKTSVIIK